jgi:ABC-type branched-subunit amino acid transport system substrate-binding protein
VTLRRGAWIPALVIWAVSCGGRRPQIAYINADMGLVRVVQQATADWGSRRITPLLIPSAAGGITVRAGDAADVDFAAAAAALPSVVAVVGHQSSRGSLLAAPIYGEAEIPFIVPTGTSRLLRDVGPWTFQLAPDDEAEGAFIASFALDRLGARRVTIFFLVADEYGIGLRDGVARALRQRGVEPVDQVGILPDSDFPRRVALSLRRAAPQVVVLATRTPEAAAIARSLHERLPDAPVILADGVNDSAFVRATGPRRGPAYAVAFWSADNPDSASRAFVAHFAEAGRGRPLPREAMYYDALMVVAQAVREVGPQRAAIGRYLRELGTTRPPYRGITGPISFARNRPTNLVVTRVGDGASGMAGRR